MGIFSFFSKEKKETLDHGLEKSKQSVFNKIARIVASKDKVDDDVLDKAVQVLDNLSDGGNHLVGIISHVSRLEESITEKIVVKQGPNGSTLRIEGTES